MKKFLLFLFIFSAFRLSAQIHEAVVGRLGTEIITQRDFVERFELAPFLSKRSGWNIDSLKTEFLFSLLAEKSWYHEALKNGLHNSTEFSFYMKPIEDIHLRDLLFRQAITSSVKLNPDDVAKAISKAQMRLVTAIVSCPDSATIFRFHSQITTSFNPDSILSAPLESGLYLSNQDIVLGSLRDEEVEDMLFSMSVGSATAPILSEAGWIVFYLKDIIRTPIDLNDKKTTDGIINTVKSRRIHIRTTEFLQEILGHDTVMIDQQAFLTAANAISDVMKQKNLTDNDSLLLLNQSDYRSILHEIGQDKLRIPFITGGNSAQTVHDFLAFLAFLEKPLPALNTKILFGRLNSLAKNFVQQSLLTEEARRRGLTEDPGYKRDTQRWKESLLAQMIKNTFIDSVRVSENDVRQYFIEEMNNDKDFLFLNLRILTLSGLQQIESVFASLDGGRKFEEILSEYGKTDSLVNESGETGLKPAIMLGNMGIITQGLEVGQLYGPIKRESGYSLIMVKEKREITDSLALDFESTKKGITDYLFEKRLREFISQKTLSLLQSQNINVYPEVLSSTTVTNVTMFVHRLMGFGGTISGTPLLDNWSEWVNPEEVKRILVLP